MPSKKQDKQTNEKISNMILNRNQFAFGFMNLKVHRHLLFDPVVSYLSLFFLQHLEKHTASHTNLYLNKTVVLTRKVFICREAVTHSAKVKRKQGKSQVLVNTINRLHGSLGITLCTSQTLYLYFHSSRKSAQGHMETQTHPTGDCILKEEKIS